MVSREHESVFLERRAEDELEAAQEAVHPNAVKAHYELACLYIERLHGNGTAPEASELPGE